jgi:hypothetical protein
MLFMKIITVYSEHHIKHINTLCGTKSWVILTLKQMLCTERLIITCNILQGGFWTLK